MARSRRRGARRRDQQLARAARWADEGALERASATYRQLLRADPDDAEVHFLLGTALSATGALDDGLPHLVRAAALRPDDPALANNLGHAQREAGQLAAAEATFAALARRHPGPHGPYGEATIALCRGQLDGARAALEEACRRDPGFVTAWRHRATVHQRLGQPEEALQCLTHAVALAPRHGPTVRRLGLLHAQHGRPALARATLAQALQLLPGDPVVRHVLAATDPAIDAPLQPEDAYVAELFDAFAEDYDDTLEGALATRVPDLVVTSLGSGPLGRTLDLGCGTGTVGRRLDGRTECLIGVDLSPKMLARAEATGAYDQLHAQSLASFLATVDTPFDTVLLADVLVYVGDLRPLLPALWSALAPGGCLVATTESAPDAPAPRGVVLRPTGRYAHHAPTLAAQLDAAGFTVTVRPEALRKEGAHWVAGHLWTLTRA